MSKSLLFLLTLFSLYFSFSFNSVDNSSHLFSNFVSQDKDIFDQETLDKLKTDDDYNYSIESQTNWWSEFKEWLGTQWRNLFGQSIDSSFWFFIFKVLPYLILVVAVVFLIWFIARSNIDNQIMRQHKTSKVTLTEEEELLMTRNLEKMADKAIENQQYRLAIRYLYLNSIKRLDLKGIIKYTNDKTNFEYLREIEFNELSKIFKHLTIAYEQTWYGQMQFDEVYFQNLQQQYEAFHNLLDQKQYAQA
ncbi:hypothetical protein [Flavobacterium sp. CS20]|uniref:hypothetical protein n=1 Tax=Flavobacterium sp. CS20 TaxID=2775246 RepID=UPI001B3A1262|nr:hypothetical protein [Flavobacterium sp. CS20]QTY28091.1 hypothetical protein IGB25_06275 [Flavobacterium sp. CS20]